MFKLNRVFHVASTVLLFSLCLYSVIASANSQLVSSGWLINPSHPPVSVQMQLTGQTDPQANTVNALLSVNLDDGWKTYWRSPGKEGWHRNWSGFTMPMLLR
ncbi:hypothetical protein [Psychromonas sp. MME1]|uniref:hypothetical protein n=1 Tax=Psychromonas sp. MME1 TaxID=3231032 RepID=UPI0034E23A63